MMSKIIKINMSNWHCPSPPRNYHHHRPHNGQPLRSTLRRPRIRHISTAECWTLKKYMQLQRQYIMLLLVRISAHLSSFFTSFDNKSHPGIFVHPGRLSAHHAIVVVLWKYFLLLFLFFEIFIEPFSFLRHFTKVCILNWKSVSHQIISLQCWVFFS